MWFSNIPSHSDNQVFFLTFTYLLNVTSKLFPNSDQQKTDCLLLTKINNTDDRSFLFISL